MAKPSRNWQEGSEFPPVPILFGGRKGSEADKKASECLMGISYAVV